MNGLTDQPPPAGYVSPFGKIKGLASRLAKWPKQLGHHGYPWVGTGIIKDLELAAQILNRREWLEALRVSDDPAAQEFAAELLDDDEELDAVYDAARHVQGLPRADSDRDAVETIEQLDKVATDYEGVRSLLVEMGVLEADDRTTPVADLLRVVLS